MKPSGFLVTISHTVLKLQKSGKRHNEIKVEAKEIKKS